MRPGRAFVYASAVKYSAMLSPTRPRVKRRHPPVHLPATTRQRALDVFLGTLGAGKPLLGTLGLGDAEPVIQHPPHEQVVDQLLQIRHRRLAEILGHRHGNGVCVGLVQHVVKRHVIHHGRLGVGEQRLAAPRQLQVKPPRHQVDITVLGNVLSLVTPMPQVFMCLNLRVASVHDITLDKAVAVEVVQQLAAQEGQHYRLRIVSVDKNVMHSRVVLYGAMLSRLVDQVAAVQICGCAHDKGYHEAEKDMFLSVFHNRYNITSSQVTILWSLKPSTSTYSLLPIANPLTAILSAVCGPIAAATALSLGFFMFK